MTYDNVKSHKKPRLLGLNIPVSNAQNCGYLLIGSPLTRLRYAEIAERRAFTVQY